MTWSCNRALAVTVLLHNAISLRPRRFDILGLDDLWNGDSTADKLVVAASRAASNASDDVVVVRNMFIYTVK